MADLRRTGGSAITRVYTFRDQHPSDRQLALCPIVALATFLHPLPHLPPPAMSNRRNNPRPQRSGQRPRHKSWQPWVRLPPFLPVPARTRRDGWTPARQARFIVLLAQTGCVRDPAQAIGLSRGAPVAHAAIAPPASRALRRSRRSPAKWEVST
jgi:hypothetical protein